MDKEILRYGKILTESGVLNNNQFLRYLNIKYNNNIYYLVEKNGETISLCNLTKETVLFDKNYN